MKYQLYKDRLHQWRWRLLADNHRRIAVSGEGYRNRIDCVSAIQLVKKSIEAPVLTHK